MPGKRWYRYQGFLKRFLAGEVPSSWRKGEWQRFNEAYLKNAASF